MTAKVYVGNLAWNTNDDALCEKFSEFGIVIDSIIMRDRETGRSRGFGFVTYGSQQEADAAIASLNEEELDGRRLKVKLANARTGGGGYGGGSGYGGPTGYSQGISGGYGGQGGYGGGYGSGGYGGGYGYGGYGSAQGGYGFDGQAGYGGAQGGYGSAQGGYGGGSAEGHAVQDSYGPSPGGYPSGLSTGQLLAGGPSPLGGSSASSSQPQGQQGYSGGAC